MEDWVTINFFRHKKSKKRSRSSSSSDSDHSSSSSDSYERRRRRKQKKAEDKQRRRDEKRALKRQKLKEEEEEKRRKEIELLGPDPELYKHRDEILDAQDKLRTGKADDVSTERKKLSKEELEQKALDMQLRAEQLEREREERYQSVLAVNEDRKDKNVEQGMQPKFVNDISKAAYVEHNMDLAESINRKKHYTQRFNDNP